MSWESKMSQKWSNGNDLRCMCERQTPAGILIKIGTKNGIWIFDWETINDLWYRILIDSWTCFLMVKKPVSLARNAEVGKSFGKWDN